MPATPDTAQGVVTRTIRLPTKDGGEVSAFVAEPAAPGPHPAIVFGAEAMGPNAFGREVATRAAAQGYVTITPDYYRGEGPSRPDDYSDFTEVMAAIGNLDFRAATFDLLAGFDWLAAQPQVDARRIATWGYCTGGTLSLLAACLERRLAATVLYFPSQPVFEALTPKRPTHPIDLVWSLGAPVLVIYGDRDPIMPPERLAELRRRLEQWDIPHEIRIYEGAGHAFSAPAPHMHNAAAADASWRDAMAFLDSSLGA